MGITKTDFMRGMQCERMLWLDRHHPEFKVIPPFVQKRLDRGNDFGDSAMGIFGEYTEVKEYYPGTKYPDKVKMAAKTRELLSEDTKVICEAAFMDGEGNYCAADILRKTDDGYEMYEVKNSPSVSETFVKDTGFQAYLIRKCGVFLKRIFIIFNSGDPEDPFEIEEITDRTNRYAVWVEENIGKLGEIAQQSEEVLTEMGSQCSFPYKCWYYGYCEACSSQMKIEDALE